VPVRCSGVSRIPGHPGNGANFFPDGAFSPLDEPFAIGNRLLSSPPIAYRGVAQPGRASGLGPEGRMFNSCRPDSSRCRVFAAIDRQITIHKRIELLATARHPIADNPATDNLTLVIRRLVTSHRDWQGRAGSHVNPRVLLQNPTLGYSW
jgi:hypothetical protein